MTEKVQHAEGSQQESIYSGADKALQGMGIGLLVVAALVLLYMLATLYGDFYGDYLTFDGPMEAIGASLGAVATTSAAIGSALLFVVSLRVQVRELRHSIEEMKNSVMAQEDAAASHKNSLTLAKQEKEFNTCLRAIDNTLAQVAAIQFGSLRGPLALSKIYQHWYDKLGNNGLAVLRNSASTPLSVLHNPEDIFRDFDEVDIMNVRLYWVLNSLRDKVLAEDDRRYLYSLINPVVKEVGKAQYLLGFILQRFDEVNALSDEELHAKGIEREAWLYYRKQFQTLQDRRKVVLMPQN